MLRQFLHERSRSRLVRHLGILDTPAGPAFDRLTGQAAATFAAPIALLTVVHDDDLWIRASTGLAVACVPRRDSFCHHAVDCADVLEVCDAAADPVFCGLPCVSDVPHVRYYLGAPVTSVRDMIVGVLCVLDTAPRPPASRDQRAYLIGLARQAAHAIERQAAITGRLVA